MQVGSSSLANDLLSTVTLSKIGQLGKTDSAKPSAAAEAARKAELSKSAQRAVLDEIREKGIYAWAQEQKFEKLKNILTKDRRVPVQCHIREILLDLKISADVPEYYVDIWSHLMKIFHYGMKEISLIPLQKELLHRMLQPYWITC